MSFLNGIFRKGTRSGKPSKRSLCYVCNNLQVTSADSKSGKTAAKWDDPGDDGLVPHLVFPPGTNPTPPAMMLVDILPRRMAEVREIDPASGNPIRTCRYCTLICDALDSFFDTSDGTPSWATQSDSETNSDTNGSPSICIMVREGHPLVINCLNFLPEIYGRRSRIDIEILLPMPPDANEPKELPLGPSIGTAAPRASDASLSMDFARNCLTECYQDHQFCKSRKPVIFTPSRLIFIGTNDAEVQLREYNAKPCAYQRAWAALSYCRGTKTHFQLTRLNKAALLKRIDITQLPVVFADAIKTARALGLTYLWVDALCIMQDDQTDWKSEIIKMGDIYSHAFVVLAAASSPEPTTTFLGPRDEKWKPHVVSFTSDCDKEVSLVVRRRSTLSTPPVQGIFDPPFTTSWATLRRDGPLYSRSWAFQELYLATRIVHFAPGAVVYECRTHRRSEDQRPPYTVTVADTLGKVTDEAKWRILVKMYSQRDLRYYKDRLTGIGGLASHMPQASTSRYVAGLWVNTFVFDLMWQSIPGSAHKPTACPKTEQRAPSWSWASLTCGVTWQAMKNPQAQALVVDIEATTAPGDRFGAVQSGSCILNTPLLPIVITTSRSRNENVVQYRKGGGVLSKKQHFWADGQLVSFKHDEMQAKTYAKRAEAGDMEEEEVEAAGVFVLLTYMNWMNSGYAGLIVSACPNVEGGYSRIGCITHLPADWAEKAKLDTIKIV
ncbi:hypothetical protein BROUX41_003117 [Berkeleyomyces rouxiae]|uniref:uncharacterized protein n=1 Tax=Berkeleyomyces rouxiae TaxID=2035830 RepID=UPI003B78689D